MAVGVGAGLLVADQLGKDARQRLGLVALIAGLAATKRMIRQSWQNSLDVELDLQRDAMRALGRTEDYREGVAAFLEKRKAAFRGSASGS
jgi:2-(1,2-epoxy-1,2-dihydrophenyl)acetyl-CoA isomerase